MKDVLSLLLMACCLPTVYAQQDIALPGLVVEQNSKYRTGNYIYLSNAQIKATGAAPQRSDANGHFTLLFTDRPGGDVARIFADKEGYELVNDAELRQASIIGRLQPLQIVMCRVGQLYDNQVKYYNIAKDASIAAYQRKLAVLEKEGREKDKLMATLRVQFNKDIKTKEEAMALLEQQRQTAEKQTKELADKWVTVNLDDESPAYQRAFAAFEAKDIELAKIILDSVDLEKRLKANSIGVMKDSLLIDTIRNRKAQKQSQIKQDVSMCVFKARLHVIDDEFALAEQFYDLAVKYDSVNFKVIFEAAVFLQEQNQFQKARTYYDKVLSQCKEANQIASVFNNIGSLLRTINEVVQARKAYQKALNIRRRLAAKNPDVYLPDLAISLNNLGALFSDIKEIAEARKLYEEALGIRKQLAAKNPDVYLPDLAMTLNNLGNLLLANNKIEEARKRYEEALVILRQLSVKTPDLYLPDLAHTLNNLGALSNIINEMTSSRKLYEEALVMRRHLAVKNPDVYLPDLASTLNNLGVLLKAGNETGDARKYYEEALVIRKQLAVKNPDVYMPQVAISLNNLGFLLKDINEIAAAQKFYEDALGVQRELVAKNPDLYLPDLAMTLNNLGILLSDNNKIEEARKLYEEALLIRRQLSVKNPNVYMPDVLMTLNNIGNLLSAINEKEQAQKLYEEAMRICRQLAAENPDVYKPSVANTLNNLGTLLKNNNEIAIARKLYQEALDIRRQLAVKTPDVYTPDVAMSLNNLGVLLKEDNKLVESQKAYEESLGIYRKLAIKNQSVFLPSVANTLSNLGSLFRINNEIMKSQNAYEESLTIYKNLAFKNPDIYNFKIAATIVGVVVVNWQLLNQTGNISLKDTSITLLQQASHYLTFYINPIPRVNRLKEFIQEFTSLFEAFDLATFQLDERIAKAGLSDSLIRAETNQHQKVLEQQRKITVIIEFGNKYPDNSQIKNLLASNYGTLAWYQLFNRQFTAAEQSASLGLQKDSSEVWINTNLALALLYQGKWEEARKIYLSLMDKPYKEGTYRATFLEDLAALEKEGITHPDAEKAKKLLMGK